MPVKPNAVTMQGTSVDVVNGVRNSLGAEFKRYLPPVLKEGTPLLNGGVATREDAVQSLRAFGSALMEYQPAQNAFLYNLINLIGRVIISSRLYRNPWAVFKKGYLEMGDTIEEIFVNLTKAHQFDPEVAETEVFKREIPDVNVAYHRLNYQKFYKVTIQRDELRQAFLSMVGVTDLISKIIETIYTSANYDEFITMKYMIATAALDGRMAPVQLASPTLETADQVMSVFKQYSDSLQYMSTKYNYAGVPTYSNKDYQYFIWNTQMSAAIDVGSLARAYNLDKVELAGRIIGVDAFTFNALELRRLSDILYDEPGHEIFTADQLTLLGKINGVLVDQAWFMIFDNLDGMDEQRNAQGRYWNYFYHVWKTFSTSPFNNAIVFIDEASSVSAITLSPATITVAPGGDVQITPTVTKTGLAMGTVQYSITGQNSSGTFISQGGVLHVSPHETSSSITVKATSVDTPSVSATATVTVGGGEKTEA